MADDSISSSDDNDFSESESVKLLILGETGIGKTTLIQSYLGAIGIELDGLDIKEGNIFSMYPSRMMHNGKTIDLGLYDLYPGANAYERRDCYPLDSNVIILCFSIDQEDTLESVCNLWIHEVRAHFGKLIPVCLVGLKSDTRLIKDWASKYLPKYLKTSHCRKKQS